MSLLWRCIDTWSVGTSIPALRLLCTVRNKSAAKLQGRLRPIQADTLQAVTLGRQPATAREAFQMQQEGHSGGAAGLTGRWRKVKVRVEAAEQSSSMMTMCRMLWPCCVASRKKLIT